MPPRTEAFETPLVGREPLLTRLAELWRDGARCITLAGTPGVGKTRLAEEALRRSNELFALSSGRVAFCALASVGDGADVAAVVADSLSVPPEVRRQGPLEGLRSWLATGPGGLVVIDNAEHVVDSVAELCSLLRRRAPQYGFLVTSRVLLQIDDETPLIVGPLAHESSEDNSPGRGAFGGLGGDAAELFVLFAGLEGRLTDDQAETVTRIVRRLEGLPLSLKLAARRLDTLSLADLDARLADKFRLVRDGARQGACHVEMQRDDALWLTLDWSWQLLADWQQSALAQLSLFRDTFTLALAERVVRLPGGDGPMAPTVVDALQGLVRHSLVERLEARSPETRYTMLETIREFAARRWSLDGAYGGERAALWERYCQTIAEVSTSARSAIVGSDLATRQAALDELDALRTDILAVITGLPGWPDPPVVTSVEVCLAAKNVLESRGEHEHQLHLISTALDRLNGLQESSEHTERLRGRLLFRKSYLLSWMSRLDESIETSHHLIELAAEIGDRKLLGEAQAELASRLLRRGKPDDEHLRAARAAIRGVSGSEGVLAKICRVESSYAVQRGDLDAAIALGRKAADLYEELGWHSMWSNALNGLGSLQIEAGDLAGALVSVERAYDLATKINDFGRATMAQALGAWARFDLGDATRDDFEKPLRRFERVNEPHNVAITRHLRALTTIGEGRLSTARDDLTDALVIMRGTYQVPFVGPCLAALAALEAVNGELELAQRLIGEARPHYEREAGTVYGRPVPLFEAIVAICRARSEASGPDDVERLRERFESAAIAVGSVGTERAARMLFERALAVGSVWRVASSGAWFEGPDAKRVSLERYSAPRALLAALAEQGAERPGEGFSRDELFEIGWPGQTIAKKAAANRVYVALSTLRKLGLDELIDQADGVYRLDPVQRVELVSET